MKILVTGGTGYIGSHTVVQLIAKGCEVVIVDNLVNSSPIVLNRIEKITGTKPTFYEADVRTPGALDAIFTDHAIDTVIHFAGLKAVGESVAKPLLYYQNNLDSTLNLLDSMQYHGVTKFIFSSSATVYGSVSSPYRETQPTGQGITNPYGRTKYMIEEILRDQAASNSDFSATCLRYFNPIGAHPSGLIGENPNGTPNNLMPYITQVASGRREFLGIFGNDYDTPDGTCVRDYIHVDDLADGHIAALTHQQPGFQAINLGSGVGTSVLELVTAFEQATGQTIPHQFMPRRAGDLPEYYADASLAREVLDWQTTRSVSDACRDSWNWQSHNPNGYA